MAKEKLDPESLDPGIRDLVIALNEAGWETTDSGDGMSKPQEERAMDFPHVHIHLSDPSNLDVQAKLLLAWLKRSGYSYWEIEATYSPKQSYCGILIYLPPEEKNEP